jgi:hypothetical protein
VPHLTRQPAPSTAPLKVVDRDRDHRLSLPAVEPDHHSRAPPRVVYPAPVEFGIASVCAKVLTSQWARTGLPRKSVRECSGRRFELDTRGVYTTDGFDIAISRSASAWWMYIDVGVRDDTTMLVKGNAWCAGTSKGPRGSCQQAFPTLTRDTGVRD